MSHNVAATLILAALLAVAGEARAQEGAPSCNPNAGRATARIACLNRLTQALSDKIDMLQTRLAENVKRDDLTNYVRRSDLENSLEDYVRYNASLAIGAASESNGSQAERRCIAADFDMESVVLDKSCNVDARPEFRWRLLPGVKSGAEVR